jgi:hypothetical protein
MSDEATNGHGEGDGLDFGEVLSREERTRVGGVWYVLREPSEAAQISVVTQQLKGATVSNGQVSGAQVERGAESNSRMLSMCLFTEDGKPVSLETIKRWPARIVAKLARRAMRMAEIGKDEEEAKNEPAPQPGPTPAG